MKKEINFYLDLVTDTMNSLDKNSISRYLDILEDCLLNKRRIFIFGNGGSGSTASHFQNDFNKAVFDKISNRFRVTCLCDNMPSVLAISNDYDYSQVFLVQLYENITKDDVIIALSGSGNSENVLKAINYAKSIGCFTVGFEGFDGGKLKEIVDLSLHVPVCNMQVAEDIHLMLNHLAILYFYQNYGEGKCNA